MRLQVTLDKKVIKHNFFGICGDEDKLTAVKRISRHTIISSKECEDIWYKYAEENGFSEDFQLWLFSIENETQKFKRLKIDDETTIHGSCSDEQKIMLATAYQSDDKIVVGNYNPSAIVENRSIKFISERAFCKPKQDSITINNIENVIDNKRNNSCSIFDIMETPVYLKVSENLSSESLAIYLSSFYKGAQNIIIQDRFLPKDSQNRLNLEQYILPYIDKTQCEITFIISKEDRAMRKAFENYNGYNTKVKCKEKEEIHGSFLQTEKYKISLGYRMMIFGKKGKTFKEDIRIDRLTS